MVKKLILITIVFVLGACQQMGSTEYGMRFWKLPPVVGGGVTSHIFQPGEMVIDIPVISKVYKFDTAVKDIVWGAEGGGTDSARVDYVQTRAFDGNEVALAMTVSYKVTTDPTGLKNIIHKVATSDMEVADLVIGAARADIRTFMNELKTAEFISKEPRYKAVDKVKSSIAARLAPYAIEIVRVNLDDFMFRRLKSDGTADMSYEERLKKIQEKREETEREKARIATVVAKKEQELNDMQAKVNQVVEEAKGFKMQAQARGDAYFEAKRNEAEAILARGRAEVEGLTEQINALSGPGGKAILKLAIAQELIRNDPKFVLMAGDLASEGIEVNKIDTNELIKQIGVIEGLSAKKTANKQDKDLKTSSSSKTINPVSGDRK